MVTEAHDLAEIASSENTPSGAATTQLPDSGSNSARDRSSSNVSVTSSISTFTPAPSVQLPAVPANSPETQSLADTASTIDAQDVTNRLKRFRPFQIASSTASTASDEDEIHGKLSLKLDFRGLRKRTVRFADEDDLVTPKAEQQQQQQQEYGVLTPDQPLKPGVTEMSKWAEIAEEDVAHSLKRLKMAAEDDHQEDPTNTVEELYSARLAKLIKAADVTFDPKYLSEA